MRREENAIAILKFVIIRACFIFQPRKFRPLDRRCFNRFDHNQSRIKFLARWHFLRNVLDDCRCLQRDFQNRRRCNDDLHHRKL